MQVLVVHPEDRPLSGPWVERRWDAVYDLARSGWAACERWSAAFGCPVKPIDGLREGYAEVRRARDLLQLGLGRLVDKEGLDWWELTAILVHQQLERLVLLWKLVDELPRDAEVWITRDGFEAGVLREKLGSRLRIIAAGKARGRKDTRHYLRRMRLPLAQVAQTLGDKYDAGYRIRRHFHREPDKAGQPVVLLPSSYINMSLLGAACARILTEAAFLLVSTRGSGRLRETPANVRQEWLAAYAGEGGADEVQEILQRWAALKKEVAAVPEFAALAQTGMLGDFPRRFADGIAIRNAWRRVLDIENVSAVLCSDDSNPYTHLPLLLAKVRGLPTIACHHGALDGRYLIKPVHADVILVKGRMEQDYLVHTCGMDPSVIEIGGFSAAEVPSETRVKGGDWIVFFSEPYEMTSGRAEEIYRDILPGLLDLSRQTGKRMVVKLHPSENLAERQSLAQRVVSREQAEAIEWVTGRLGPELLERTWFGLTVQSSVVVECTVRGAPCFLCEWLDLWPYGYVAQFRKFGVGIGLRSPRDIQRIPEILGAYHPDRRVAGDCWQAITRERFQDLLAGRREPAGAGPVPMRRDQ